MSLFAPTLEQAVRSYQSGELAEAEHHCRQILDLDPNQIDALHLLGLIAGKAGRPDLFERHLREVVRLQPSFAEAHNNLGVALREQGKLAEAEAHFRQAIERKPDYTEAYSNLGSALGEQDRLEEAIGWYREALRLRPDYAEAHNSLGNTYQDLGQLTEAAACHAEALRINPGYAGAWRDLGVVQREQGQLTEAEASYNEAIRLRPDYAEAHLNRAILWLLMGDFERGWPEFEWRWRTRDIVVRSFPQPRWDGAPLPDGTILIYAEQGFGDTLQFIRYVERVKERVGRVVVECQPSLEKLLAGVAGIDMLVPEGAPLPEFDVQAPLLSLPRLFEAIPVRTPYLTVPPGRVEAWRERLARVPGFKVGICWQGFLGRKSLRRRTVALERLAPLAEIAGVCLVRLQRGPGSEQLADVRFPVWDPPDWPNDPGASWIETASLMQALDLIVTIDTAVAHLAGALGVPTWVLLPFAADWRWFLGRDDSPWYPSLRLFRQPRPGAWTELLDRVALEMQSHLRIAK